MTSKKKEHPTIKQHVQIGMDIRTARRAVARLLNWSTRGFLYAADVDGLIRADRRLDLIRYRLEERMETDYPELRTREGETVYYGHCIAPSLAHLLGGTAPGDDAHDDGTELSCTCPCSSARCKTTCVCFAYVGTSREWARCELFDVEFYIADEGRNRDGADCTVSLWGTAEPDEDYA